MIVDGKQMRPIWQDENEQVVKIIDQRQLPHELLIVDLTTVDQHLRETLGLQYGYLKAIILGVRTYFGLTDDKHTPTDHTPNGLIYTGLHYLVDYI